MHEDLFNQAEALAKLDAKKRKQANLLRAVSSTYYAVFHFLVDDACRVQIGAHRAQAAYRRVLGRAYSHSVMKQACVSFGGGTLKAAVARGLPTVGGGTYSIPQPIQDLAVTFSELQEKRHLADYDLTEQFSRLEVLAMIDQARNRVAAFAQLPASDDKRFFLACLWAWKELVNR